MPQKPKAGRSKSSAGKASDQKKQSERFIETARELGVDESGKEFDRALKKLMPTQKKRRVIGAS